MSNIIKRRRGRIKGRPNGMRVTPVRDITNWKPIHDNIINLFVLGIKQVKIAKQLQVTFVTVQNVIKSPTGLKKIAALTEAHTAAIRGSQLGKIDEIKKTAIDNIHTVVTNKNILETKPQLAFENSLKAIQLFDKSGLVNKPSDNPSQPGNTTNINNLNVISGNPEFVNRLVTGLDKIQEIQQRLIKEKK